MNKAVGLLAMVAVLLTAFGAAHASPESEAFARKYYNRLLVVDNESEMPRRTLVDLHQEVPDALKADVLADLLAMDKANPKSMGEGGNRILEYLAQDRAKKLVWNERLRSALLSQKNLGWKKAMLLRLVDHLEASEQLDFIRECLKDQNEGVRLKAIDALVKEPDAKAQLQAYIEANQALSERRDSVEAARRYVERAP